MVNKDLSKSVDKIVYDIKDQYIIVDVLNCTYLKENKLKGSLGS